MVYASMSADESCNLPMVEANAMGIPAVVFDCRGNYSAHCEYIKYGIVVNIEKRNKLSKEEIMRFRMSMEWISHYHLCTRGFGINCIIPKIPDTKFYDFPLSLAEWDNNYKKKCMRRLSAKEWHYNALKYYNLI